MSNSNVIDTRFLSDDDGPDETPDVIETLPGVTGTALAPLTPESAPMGTPASMIVYKPDSVDIATRSNIFDMNETGLALRSGVSFDEFKEGVRALINIGFASEWLIGDAQIEGEREYGDEFGYALTIDKYSAKTLANIRSVCNKVAKERRRAEVSFGLHAELAALPADEQERWLRYITREGAQTVERNKLRALVARYRAYELAPDENGELPELPQTPTPPAPIYPTPPAPPAPTKPAAPQASSPSGLPDPLFAPSPFDTAVTSGAAPSPISAYKAELDRPAPDVDSLGAYDDAPPPGMDRASIVVLPKRALQLVQAISETRNAHALKAAGGDSSLVSYENPIETLIAIIERTAVQMGIDADSKLPAFDASTVAIAPSLPQASAQTPPTGKTGRKGKQSAQDAPPVETVAAVQDAPAKKGKAPKISKTEQSRIQREHAESEPLPVAPDPAQVTTDELLADASNDAGQDARPSYLETYRGEDRGGGMVMPGEQGNVGQDSDGDMGDFDDAGEQDGPNRYALNGGDY